MAWQKVQSSWIRDVNYDPDTRILLVRWLKDSAIFAYFNITQAAFDAFMASPSKGRFLLNAILPVRVGTRQTDVPDG